MSTRFIAVAIAAAFIGTPSGVRAQNPRPAALDTLNHALQRISARLDSVEAGSCPAGPAKFSRSSYAQLAFPAHGGNNRDAEVRAA
ncbi:MAG: hypothetical protein ACREMO_07230 [Gemmatimonadales bacterium]